MQIFSYHPIFLSLYLSVVVLFYWQGFKLTKQSTWRSTANWQAVSTSRYPVGRFLADQHGLGLQLAQLGRDASAAVSILHTLYFGLPILCNVRGFQCICWFFFLIPFSSRYCFRVRLVDWLHRKRIWRLSNLLELQENFILTGWRSTSD